MLADRCRAGGRRRVGDGGFATAELAVALPVLMLLFALLLWGIAAITAQLRCVDAARVGARAAARGEGDIRSVALARAAAPVGARVRVLRSAQRVVVEVVTRIGPPTAWRSRFGATEIAATAVAETEPEAGR